MTQAKKGGFLATLSHLKNYFTADIATKALGFISIPVLTRLLSTGEYGIVNLFNAYVGILVIIFSLNSHASISRYFYEDKEDFKQFFSTSVILVLIIFALFTTGSLIFKEELIGLIELPENLYWFFFPVVFVEISSVVFIQVFQPQHKSRRIAIANVIRAYTRFGLGVLIIVLLQQDKYLGMIIANAITGIAVAVYFIIALKPYFKFSFNKKYLKYIMSYSFPMLPYAMSSIILAQFDRIMVNNYKGESDAGLYSFAYNIGMLLAIFVGAVNRAFTPDYFKYMNEGNIEQHDKDVDRFFRLTVLAGVGLIFFGKEIGMILAKEDFHTALNVVPLVVMGYLFYGIFTIYIRNIGYAKKTVFSSIILVISSAANIVLNAIYIPQYGYIAAAYTTLVSYALMGFLSWLFSKLFLDLHVYPLRSILLPLAISTPFIAGYYYLEQTDIGLWLGVGIKIVVMGLLTLILMFKYRHHLTDFMRKK